MRSDWVRRTRSRPRLNLGDSGIRVVVGPVQATCNCCGPPKSIRLKTQARDYAQGWLSAQKCKSTSALPCRQHAITGEIVGLLVIARYDGLKYPVRHEWSELQRAGRKVAECGSPQPQCSTSSLRS
jgi:hypothetical protein